MAAEILSDTPAWVASDLRMDSVDGFISEPGRRWGRLLVGETANGEVVGLPFACVVGKRSGPTVLLVACLHGDEVLGSEVVRQTIRSLDPETMDGVVLALPMVNVLAVASRTRRAMTEPYPGPHDMNRVFPGRADGVFAERLAALVTSEFLVRADAVIDLHTPAVGAVWLPYAFAPILDEASQRVAHQSRALAESVGMPLVVSGAAISGSLVETAYARGVPASYVEFGETHTMRPEDVAFGTEALIRFLGAAGTIRDVPTAPASPVVVTDITRLTASRAGYLKLTVTLGEVVAADSTIGVVEAMDGRTVERVVAPFDALCCRLTTTGLVATGDPVAFLGRIV